MKEQNNIDEIFKQAFEKFEVDPGKGMWAKVQSGVNTAVSSGTAASAASSSTFSWVATAIVAVSITSAAIGGYFYFNEKGEEKKNTSIEKNEVSTEIAQEKSSIESSKNANENITTEKVLNVEDLSQNTSAKKIETASISTKKNTTTSGKSGKQVNTEEKSNIKAGINQSETTSTSETEDLNPKVEENLTQDNSNSSQSTESINTATNTPTKEHLAEKENSIATESETSPSQNGVSIDPIEDDEALIVKLEFPNVFTPNNDGSNDSYGINQALSVGLENVENARMIIKNITGKVVYQWEGVEGSWNGTLPNGNLAPEGTYLYQFVYFINGEAQEPKTGILSLKL